MLRLILLLTCFLSLCQAQAQLPNLVTYAGNSGKETFYDIVQISDGTFLVAGYADNLDWVDDTVPRIELSTEDISNERGNDRYGFLIHLSVDLNSILHIVHFPKGGVEDIRFIKLTNAPYEETGDIFISGNTADTKNNKGGYFIAKLNNNFVKGIPSDIEWSHPVWAEGEIKSRQPWDVGYDGKVVYVSGQSHDYDWSAAYRLDEEGRRAPVEGWRNHWPISGGEFRGYGHDYPDGIGNIDHSGIVFKSWGRCELRSWTMSDYTLVHSDENGGLKQGLWPLDFMYDSPCDTAMVSTDGPGYTGYSPGATPVYGPSSIAIDRRTNDLYLGMNLKTKLPGGNPDFEPAVIAMDGEGYLRWWSRLYHEITPSGDTVNSTPDQYIDALAIDYSVEEDEAFLVVNARCHGNNVENLWEGSSIAANPNATGFQNRFTGTSGNIHISWLGKLKLSNGNLHHATYVAEYAEGTAALGAPHPDPNLDGWPNPNGGWPDVNTTRLAENNMKVTADGSVCILGTGRRTITTANAYQKMVKPCCVGLSAWNEFVRIYEPDFSVPKYSSLLVGVWDTLSQAGGGNTDLFGVFKTADGVVAVGRQKEDANNPGTARGNDIPISSVPSWGSDVSDGESAILLHYTAPEIVNPDDSPIIETTNVDRLSSKLEMIVFPNPTSDQIIIQSNRQLEEACNLVIRNIWGQEIFRTNVDIKSFFELDLEGPVGVYLLEVKTSGGSRIFKIVKH